MDERERQYQEYLSLREKKPPEEDKYTYGESEMRRIYQEKAHRERVEAVRERIKQGEREQYLAARDHEHHEHHERKESFETPVRANRAERNKRKSRSERRSAFEKKAKAEKDHIKEGARQRIQELKSEVDLGAVFEKDTDGKRRRPKAGRGKRTVRRLTLVLLLLAILAAGGVLMAFASIMSMEDVDIDKNAIAINPEVATQLDNYTNIAVLGTDARVKENEGDARSDAIIVASINKETNEVKMFSVFRDTLLDVGDQGLDKITHAYAYGGPQQSLYTLNKNLDLNIDKVVVINWKTVANMIDAIGGIEINVKESEIDELNKYIKETAKNVDGPTDKIKKPGKQTLNGVQAVTYSRIRKDAATGDYRRNERMKIVFSKTFKKLRESGYLKMFSVARKTMPEVGTNMSTNEIVRMMLKFKAYDMTDSTTGFPYDVGGWTGYAGAGYAWYGPPINLSNNVSKLHEQFFDQGGYTPTDTVQEISAEISALTGLY
ncbi:MAG: LCP family protein [Firmicutes bacterium]|nr:LCP family protein [Bacillota bacterium]